MPIGDWSSHVCSSDLTVRPSPAWPARRSASSAPRRPRSSASWSRRRRWSSAIPAPRATAPPPSSDRRSACSQRRNVGGVLALPHIHSGKVRDIYAIGDDRLQIGRAHVELQSLMRISYAVFCLKKKTEDYLLKHEITPTITHNTR